MIDYKDVKVGDLLRITGAGAPKWYELGDIVRVVEVHTDRGGSAMVERLTDQKPATFFLTCGAERLEFVPPKDGEK
jgi:hypothetical protein